MMNVVKLTQNLHEQQIYCFQRMFDFVIVRDGHHYLVSLLLESQMPKFYTIVLLTLLCFFHLPTLTLFVTGDPSSQHHPINKYPGAKPVQKMSIIGANIENYGQKCQQTYFAHQRPPINKQVDFYCAIFFRAPRKLQCVEWNNEGEKQKNIQQQRLLAKILTQFYCSPIGQLVRTNAKQLLKAQKICFRWARQYKHTNNEEKVGGSWQIGLFSCKKMDNVNGVGLTQVKIATSPARVRYLQTNFTFTNVCSSGCDLCNIAQCQQCKTGFIIGSDKECHPHAVFYFFSVFLGFGLGTFQQGFALEKLFHQFAYYQYMPQNDQNLLWFFQFTGNLNRERLFPLYLRTLTATFFQQITRLKSLLIPAEKKYYTPNNFLLNQGYPVHQISNVFSLFLFSLPVLIVFSLLVRFIRVLWAYLQIQAPLLERYSCFFGFVLMFLQAFGQYLSFVFWKQIHICSFYTLADKANLYFAIVSYFFITVFSLALYPISSFIYCPSTLQSLFPFRKRRSENALIYSIISGPAYYLIAGGLHSINSLVAAKLSLLILLNALCILAEKAMQLEGHKTIFLSKMSFFFILIWFNVTKLVSVVVVQLQTSLLFSAVEKILLLSLVLLTLIDGLNWLMRKLTQIVYHVADKFVAKQEATLIHTKRSKIPPKNNQNSFKLRLKEKLRIRN